MNQKSWYCEYKLFDTGIINKFFSKIKMKKNKKKADKIWKLLNANKELDDQKMQRFYNADLGVKYE